MNAAVIIEAVVNDSGQHEPKSSDLLHALAAMGLNQCEPMDYRRRASCTAGKSSSKSGS